MHIQLRGVCKSYTMCTYRRDNAQHWLQYVLSLSHLFLFSYSWLYADVFWCWWQGVSLEEALKELTVQSLIHMELFFFLSLCRGYKFLLFRWKKKRGNACHWQLRSRAGVHLSIYLFIFLFSINALHLHLYYVSLCSLYCRSGFHFCLLLFLCVFPFTRKWIPHGVIPYRRRTDCCAALVVMSSV